MPQVRKEIFGNTPHGTTYLYTLSNDNDMVVKVTTYGGIITTIIVPDRNDHPIDVVLGFDNIEQYLSPHPHFGGLIGRYGNRIAGGKFSLGDNGYQLAQNNGPNNLHGGPIGFDKMLHEAESFETDDTVGVAITRLSPHMESGFPGNLSYKVYYTLTNNDELIITYEATTDQPTIVNLTNHSYFNLAGEGSGDILETELLIHADTITEVDKHMIPTGEFEAVKGGPFDFTNSKTLGQDIDAEHSQLKLGNGYDHNFVMAAYNNSLEAAATAYHPATGIEMDVYTTEPGMQLYTANWLDGSLIGKSGKPYERRHGFCLETQHHPDSPNQKHFPTTRLDKGDVYQSQTVYQFGVRG